MKKIDSISISTYENSEGYFFDIVTNHAEGKCEIWLHKKESSIKEYIASASVDGELPTEEYILKMIDNCLRHAFS
ncbi:hypothetical protein H0486_17290 [Lachnospiraceae bacterium MD1]|jgi:hypothetical protein|uniref:Uncharacterized protein n=1 Tax=Variimorphobacter saccharofermentans TaxID=2755051 RepID=A0A839K5J7_9FIRM|nr:hypothetical protein [Variimorphobacter saccharofermentans]MBB2184628.1 hypothetical protein [Variimorphobacter saccharofermentans]